MPNSKETLLNTAALAQAMQPLLDQCDIPPKARIRRQLARVIRTAAENGQLKYQRVNNRYYFDSNYAPVAAEILGLRTVIS